MRKFARWALGLTLCLSLLVCAALAADDSNIKVQLDGQDLAFTDAVPQMKDWRTFLPFRAVFEAMGAQVDYEGDVITAVREDKTLTMIIGSTQAAVTEDDQVTPIVMDVAPYVDPATWRTYVPVRFAAQAFGCVVGWDQEAQTAIIVDTEKLMDQARSGKSFTYLQKLAEIEAPYSAGIWDVEGTFDASVSASILPLLTMDGTVRGTVQDSAQVAMDVDMELDVSEMAAMLTGGENSALAALATDGAGVRVRGDAQTGIFYMNMDLGAMTAQAGLDADIWLELDTAALLEQAGLGSELFRVMDLGKGLDSTGLLSGLLSLAEPDDADTAYAQVSTLVQEILTALSDESFVLEGDAYTTSYRLPNGMVLSVWLEMDGDTAQRYTMGIDRHEFTGPDSAATISFTLIMDRSGQMRADFSGNREALSLDMTLQAAYTPGTTAPETTPPAGAEVVSFSQLMESAN